VRIVHYGPWALAAETGSAVSILGWCGALSQAGHDVRLLVDRNAASRPPPEGVSSVSLSHRYRARLTMPTAIGPFLEGADIFVVHGGWTAWNIAACRQAQSHRVPYVITTHGVYYPQTFRRNRLAKKIWYPLLERPHLDRAIALHLFFDDEREGLRQLRVSTPTIVAPNGVTRQEVRWDGGSGGYLLWLGRFDPQVKALDLLLQSLLAIDEGDRPVLRLYGPEFRGHKARLSALVRDKGLTKWVTIGDPVYGADKSRLIAGAAACVYPSRWDASPMAVAEAIGAGVPTLVADYPLGRLLASEGAALLCERTPAGIAEGIRVLLSSEGAKFAEHAERVARDRLSWDALASTWADQLRGLLETRSQWP
jgi:glycosyltransferase involved in cell wall biosynthesis